MIEEVVDDEPTKVDVISRIDRSKQQDTKEISRFMCDRLISDIIAKILTEKQKTIQKLEETYEINEDTKSCANCTKNYYISKKQLDHSKRLMKLLTPLKERFPPLLEDENNE